MRVAFEEPTEHEPPEVGSEGVFGEPRVEVFGLCQRKNGDFVAGSGAVARRWAERERGAERGVIDLGQRAQMARLMNYLVLVAVLGLSGDALAQPSRAQEVVTAIDALLSGQGLSGATFGVVVMEAASGRVIYQHAADVPLNPASNAKVLTAAAALAILGADRRFSTGLYGVMVPGAVSGPLVLRGQGDPSLRTEDLWAMARELFALGVRRVDGEILVDDSYLGSEHLPPCFEQQPRETAAFRASVGAVSVDENTLALHVAPGAAPGAPALVSVDPSGYIELENALTTSAGGAPSVSFAVTAGAGGRERGRVSGSFPITSRGATYTRRLDNPGLAAGFGLKAALEAAGIHVRGGVRVSATALSGAALLASHRSAPLSSLLYEVGKDSNNFYAEMMLLAIAAEPMAGAVSGAVSFGRGAQRVMSWAQRAGVATTGMALRNGSGLYDCNRVSARQLATALRAVWRDPGVRDEYISQLSVGGDDGTLRNRLRIAGAERWVRAKTGTLNDAIALSGFVLCPDVSRTLVFSVVSNGVQGRGAQARQVADGVVTELVRALMRAQ